MGSGNLRGAGLRARCVFRERVTLIHCVIHARMRVGAARVRAANDGSHLPTTSHLRLDVRPGIQVIGGGVLTPRVHRRSFDELPLRPQIAARKRSVAAAA